MDLLQDVITTFYKIFSLVGINIKTSKMLHDIMAALDRNESPFGQRFVDLAVSTPKDFSGDDPVTIIEAAATEVTTRTAIVTAMIKELRKALKLTAVPLGPKVPQGPQPGATVTNDKGKEKALPTHEATRRLVELSHTAVATLWRSAVLPEEALPELNAPRPAPASGLYPGQGPHATSAIEVSLGLHLPTSWTWEAVLEVLQSYGILSEEISHTPQEVVPVGEGIRCRSTTPAPLPSDTLPPHEENENHLILPSCDPREVPPSSIENKEKIPPLVVQKRRQKRAAVTMITNSGDTVPFISLLADVPQVPAAQKPTKKTTTSGKAAPLWYTPMDRRRLLQAAITSAYQPTETFESSIARMAARMKVREDFLVAMIPRLVPPKRKVREPSHEACDEGIQGPHVGDAVSIGDHEEDPSVSVVEAEAVTTTTMCPPRPSSDVWRRLMQSLSTIRVSRRLHISKISEIIGAQLQGPEHTVRMSCVIRAAETRSQRLVAPEGPGASLVNPHRVLVAMLHHAHHHNTKVHEAAMAKADRAPPQKGAADDTPLTIVCDTMSKEIVLRRVEE